MISSEQLAAKQTIALQGSDQQNVYAVTGDDVNILPSSASAHARDASNKIHVNLIAKFDWEHRYNHGNLVAAHHGRSLVAIVMKRQNPAASDSGSALSGGAAMVRVRSLKDESSTLLRGFEGRVLDVAFSYVESETLLCAIDERGTFFVFRIDPAVPSKPSELQHTLLLQVTCHELGSTGASAEAEAIGLVFWTRYVPEDEDEADDDNENESDTAASRSSRTERIAQKERALRTVLITFNDFCALVDVAKLVQLYATRSAESQPVAGSKASTIALSLSDLLRHAIAAEDHTRSITDAQISPDGSAFATASLDGCVRFYSASLDDLHKVSDQHAASSASDTILVKKPIHTWYPHDRRPVSALRFLDNYQDPSTSVWRYALTAADSGREIKLWLCTEWRCMQTIRFVESPIEAPRDQRIPIAIKLAVDDSAQYVVATDVRRRVLYVLHTSFQSDSEDASLETSTDNEESIEEGTNKVLRCRFSQLAEFVLSVPCLSFGLFGTSTQQRSVSLSDSQALNASQQQTEINLISVHTRQVQQMSIRYRTPPPPVQTDENDRNTGVGAAEPVSSLARTDRMSEITQMVEKLGLDLNGEAAHSTVLGGESSSRMHADLRSPNDTGSLNGSDYGRTDEELAVINMLSPRGVETKLIGPDAFVASAPLSASAAEGGADSENTTLRESSASELTKAARTDAAKAKTDASVFAVVSDSSPSASIAKSKRLPATLVTQSVASGSRDRLLQDGKTNISPRLTASSEAPLRGLPSGSLSHSASGTSSSTINREGTGTGAGAGATYPLGATGASANEIYERFSYVTSAKDTSSRSTLTSEAANGVQSSTDAVQNDVRALGQMVAQLAQTVHSHQQLVEEQLARINAASQNAARLPAQQSAFVTVADLKALLDKQETAMTSRFDREMRRVQAGVEQSFVKFQNLQTQQQAALAAQPLSETQVAALRDAMQRATNECIAATQHDLRLTLDAIRKDGAAQLGAANAAFDTALRQELTRWLSAKSTHANISQAVAGAVRGEALAAVADAFERVALPAYQRATDALFAQLNQTFKQGCAEWMAHVTAVGDTSNARLSAAFELAAQDSVNRLKLEAAKTLTEAANAALNATLTGTGQRKAENEGGNTTLADAVAQAVVERLKPELASQLNDSLAGAFGRSRAPTPGEKRCDPARLTQLVAERRYNEAFQEALSANSLRYVVHVCEQVRAGDLFAITPCPLQKPVLLSLMQQLSVALETASPKQLTTRIEYLQTALTCIEPSDEVVRDHIQRVATSIIHAVDSCLQKEAFAANKMQLRTLRLLAQSFIK